MRLLPPKPADARRAAGVVPVRALALSCAVIAACVDVPGRAAQADGGRAIDGIVIGRELVARDLGRDGLLRGGAPVAPGWPAIGPQARESAAINLYRLELRLRDGRRVVVHHWSRHVELGQCVHLRRGAPDAPPEIASVHDCD